MNELLNVMSCIILFIIEYTTLFQSENSKMIIIHMQAVLTFVPSHVLSIVHVIGMYIAAKTYCVG